MVTKSCAQFGLLVAVAVLGMAVACGQAANAAACAGGVCPIGQAAEAKTCDAADKTCAKCPTGMTELSEEAKAAKAKVEAAGLGFLTAHDLKHKLASGKAPIVIDTLGADSYTKSHIKGAINVPYDKVAELAPTILPDKNAEIVVYCGSYKCGASLQAGKALKALGYTNVHDFKGGLKEWKALGLPLEGAEVKAN